MENTIWHFDNNFTKLSAEEILKNLLDDDRKNYDRAMLELSEDIKLLDEAITLYIESLQAAYTLIEEWKNNRSNRAAISMLASTLNYVLLARYGILMGYYAEIRDLLRSCYERISRSYLFFYSEKFAIKFLAGEEIKQSDVDEEISKLEKDPDKRNAIFTDLRKYYKLLAGVAHPNLKSFDARCGGEKLGERVGVEYIFGGVMSTERGHVTIIRILQTTLSALRILGVVLSEQSGNWNKKYQQISARCNEMVDKLKTNIDLE